MFYFSTCWLTTTLSLFVYFAAGSTLSKLPITFKTEPTFEPRIFNTSFIHPKCSTDCSTDYLFITPPVQARLGQQAQIYDADGVSFSPPDTQKSDETYLTIRLLQNLVWSSIGLYDPRDTLQDLHVCDYLGDNGRHLCMHASGDEWGASGRKVFLDQSYSLVGLNYVYPGGLYLGEKYKSSYRDDSAWPDQHEFNVVDRGEHFLQPVARQIQLNLRSFGKDDKAYVSDACFNEISIRTGDPTFEWCYMDHYDLSDDFTLIKDAHQDQPPSPSESKPSIYWDPLHINAIDKTLEGDYLVSLRHPGKILKIAGTHNPHGLEPGTTIWQLGVKEGDFKIRNFTFGKQHNVRSISVSETEEVFSIVNNAWETNAMETDADSSSGQIIKVNNATMEAFLVQELPHPDRIFTPSRGNLHRLRNGNALLGWGGLPQISEFAPDGTLLWHTTFQWTESSTDFSYRAFKFPWVGKPHWSPKLVAYSYSCSSPLKAFVSWNGATEVTHWRFYIGKTRYGEYDRVGTFEKAGFETEATLLSHGFKSSKQASLPRYVKVEALDKDGNVLGTAMNETFVPDGHTLDQCDINGCASNVENSRLQSCAWRCSDSYLRVALPVLIVGCIFLEVLVASTQHIWSYQANRFPALDTFKSSSRY